MSEPDIDLSGLRASTTPEPSEQAAIAARHAALNAFVHAQNNFGVKTQGSVEQSRLIRISTFMWSTFMNTRLITSTALATVIIAPIVGIATWNMLQNQNFTPITVENLQAENEGSSLAGAGQNATQPSNSSVAKNDSANRQEVILAAPKVEATHSGEVAVSDAAEMAPQAQLAPQTRVRSAQLDKRKLAAKPSSAAMPEAMSIDQENNDQFPQFQSNTVTAVATQPVSTFSVDVDTSGYSSMRRALNSGVLPDQSGVRVEELINYFPYGYAGPEKADEAFKANVTVTPSPWNQNTKLLHIGIKGYDIPSIEQKSANLVFLLDVSGSMNEPDKLPLLKSSFRLLVNKLKPTDTVSIVTYAGNAGIVLEPTKVSEKTKILDAIDQLQPGGSTAGEAGIQAAYKLAETAFVKNGVNRIMLATDGDFNVGAASDEDLKKLVEDKRKTGVFLSVLGFGQGNYQDNLMQTLAQNGNGIAAYIDTLSEAEKVLVQEASASLFTIAKDVKIQVEFNPARVSEYRLIGYETRHLANEDFNNDRVDAGDIGSGHTVTAIYEITPKGARGQNDPLRYQTETKLAENANDEFAFVKIRYKLPNENYSRLVTQPVTDSNAVETIANASDDVRFGIAVSAFGQKLRDGDAVASYPMVDIEKLAQGAKGADAFGYRSEFLKMVRLAKSLTGQ